MIVDLFAGPGGWDTGVRLAGYDGALVGIEHDMSACRTAVAAGHARVCADVATYPTAPFVGKVDGLIASPPCQAWSSAGDRKGELDRSAVYARITAYARGQKPAEYDWADERSKLTAEPMRWAAALLPRWIALEQVPPVLPLWYRMAALLGDLGYRTWTGILSAEEFGVPQTRKRAILLARRGGLSVGPPAPTHQPYRAGRPAVITPDLFGDPLPAPVPMAEALGWGMTGRPSTTVVTSDGGGRGPLDGGAHSRGIQQREREEGRWVLRNGNQANACARALDEPAGTLFFSQRTNAVDWIHTRPATTVCGDARLGAPGHRDREGGERQFGEKSVRVTVQEAGVLQSFPADYPWQGTKSKQYEQVGNAIPPMLAAAILRPLLNAASQSREVAA